MFKQNNQLPSREQTVGSITSADYWTIFTSCPIEKGSPIIYSMYCRTKEAEQRASKAQSKCQDGGMGM